MSNLPSNPVMHFDKIYPCNRKVQEDGSIVYDWGCPDKPIEFKRIGNLYTPRNPLKDF